MQTGVPFFVVFFLIFGDEVMKIQKYRQDGQEGNNGKKITQIK